MDTYPATNVSGMFSNVLIITHLVRNIQAVTESLANSKNVTFQRGLQVQNVLQF